MAQVTKIAIKTFHFIPRINPDKDPNLKQTVEGRVNRFRLSLSRMNTVEAVLREVPLCLRTVR